MYVCMYVCIYSDINTYYTTFVSISKNVYMQLCNKDWSLYHDH